MNTGIFVNKMFTEILLFRHIMRIIAKQADYYDCIMKQGLDKTLLYHRTTEQQILTQHTTAYRYYQQFKERTINDYVHLPEIKPNQLSHYLTVDTGLLGFCGQQYLIISCQYQTINISSSSYSRWLDKLKENHITPHHCLYDLLHDYLYNKQKQYSRQRRAYITIDGKEKLILSSFKQDNAIKLPDELFIELNCPVFLIYTPHHSQTTLIKNPLLKPLDFQCLLNPQQCFQEIAMYLGNFLTQKDNPKQITDNKVLCAAKGFDIKTSFRKSN